MSRFGILFGIVGISLIGCGTVYDAETRLEIYCPPLIEYEEEYRNKLADEVQELPSGSLIPEALTDYVELRGLIRVCIEERDS